MDNLGEIYKQLFLDHMCQNPDDDGWSKHKQVLKYLKGTRNLDLTLTGDQVGLITWYVDATLEVNEDCEGHIRANDFWTWGCYQFLMKKETEHKKLNRG